MKAAISRITESAKRRDTIGRNRVSVIKDTQVFGARLFDYQNNFSSDNVEKLTTVLLRDETSKCTFILKYRIQIICGDSDDMYTDGASFTDYLKHVQSNKVDGKGEITDDK